MWRKREEMVGCIHIFSTLFTMLDSALTSVHVVLWLYFHFVIIFFSQFLGICLLGNCQDFLLGACLIYFTSHSIPSLLWPGNWTFAHLTLYTLWDKSHADKQKVISDFFEEKTWPLDILWVVSVIRTNWQYFFVKFTNCNCQTYYF